MWEFISGLFKKVLGGGSVAPQIGKGNQSTSGVTVGDASGNVAVGVGGDVHFHIPPVPPTPLPQPLSTDAQELLLQIGSSANGCLLRIRSDGGGGIWSNGKTMNKPHDMRDLARWEAAVDELEQKRFICDMSNERKQFRLTNPGYEEVERLQKFKNQALQATT